MASPAGTSVSEIAKAALAKEGYNVNDAGVQAVVDKVVASVGVQAPRATPKVIPALTVKVGKGKKSSAPTIKAVTTTAKPQAESKSSTGLQFVDLPTPPNSEVEFLWKAIRYYATANHAANPKFASKGVHTRFSGVTEAVMSKFGCNRESAVEFMKSCNEAGLLQQHPCKRGFMIYCPGDMPEQKKREPRDVAADLDAIEDF